MAFKVTYNGNGNTSGQVPVDNNSYNAGDTVPVLPPQFPWPGITSQPANTVAGTLVRANGSFGMWNTQADESGTWFYWPAGGASFQINASVTLYAQWFITDGLNSGGVKTHYTFGYHNVLETSASNPTGPEPARTNQLVDNCEADYQIMSNWFGGTYTLGGVVTLPIQVFIANLSGGANASSIVVLKPGAGNGDSLRCLLVAEVTEYFMHAQNKGWGFVAGADNEESCGEGLSLFLTQQFALLQGFANPYSFIAHTANTWLNTSLPTSNPNSTRFFDGPTGFDYGSRADYVNSIRPYPGNGPATGCSILFLYYLYHQLGFTIPQIIAAAPGFKNGNLNATATLRGVYQNLTGDAGDPFPYFKAIVGNLFPPNQVASIPGANPDDPFPIASNIAAFQANTTNLWVAQNDQKLGMMAATSPSIAAAPTGGWFAAFQANTGNLWVMGSENSVGDMKLGMMAGTSPSIAVTPNGGWFVAFEANTTNLWVMGSQNSVGDMKLGMMAGTSPSITATPNGGWFAAFQANTTNLWVMGSQNSVGDMKLGMMAKTSPSIAATPSGGWFAAFQANTGNLWVMGSQNSVGDMKLGMMAGTSPSIAVTPNGGWFVAFQANTGNLWIMGSQDSVGDMKLGMMAGTSPSIAATPDGGWVVAFQANTGNLWIMGSKDSAGDMQLGMMKGSSPSIAELRRN